MNGRDIFLGLSYIGEDLIQKAEQNAFPKHGAKRRWLLVAAVLSALLLAGCAVVYALTMHNMQLGVEAVPGAEERGKPEKQQVLTLAGLKGSRNYQAAMAWYQFKRGYTPAESERDRVLAAERENAAYHIYTQRMREEFEQILQTYQLKSAGGYLSFSTVGRLCDALGVERIQTTQTSIEITVDGGNSRANGNFQLGLLFDLPKEEGSFDPTGRLYWHWKDSFSDEMIRIADTGDWESWNYTTEAGEKVLLIRSDSDSRGWIVCDRGDAFLSLQLETWRMVDSRQRRLTNRQMEQIADAVNFGMTPRRIGPEDADSQLITTKALTQDGYTLTIKTVETDGRLLHLVVGITAPEGIVISRNPEDTQSQEPYALEPGDPISLRPVRDYSTATTFTGNWKPQEDGDGLDNTQDIVLHGMAWVNEEDSPLGPGTRWTVDFYDLYGVSWDEEEGEKKQLLAEGEWHFELNFQETSGQYRQLELLQEPVEVMSADGKIRLTSLKLRAFSCEMEYTGPEEIYYTTCDYTGPQGQQLWVVLQDGSKIRLLGYGMDYEAQTPIDLDQVDYVQFPDGTRVYAATGETTPG